MDFYSIVLMVAVVLLILALTGVGLVMSDTVSSNSNETQSSNKCPNSGNKNPSDISASNTQCNSY